MYRILIVFVACLTWPALALAQDALPDSIESQLVALSSTKERLGLLLDYGVKTNSNHPAVSASSAKRALELATQMDSANAMAKAHNILGMAYKFQGANLLALDHFMKGVELHQEVDNNLGIGLGYNNIGTIHSKLNNNELTYEYFKKARDIFEVEDHKFYLCLANNNIGAYYEAVGDTEQALAHYLENLRLQGDSGDQRIIGASYNNIGWIYLEEGNALWARDYLMLALQAKRARSGKGSIANTMTNLAKANHMLGHPQIAKNYIDSALTIATDIGDKSLEATALRHKAEIEADNGNSVLAFKLLQKSTTINDSLRVEEQSEKLAELQSGFEFQQNQFKIQLLEDAQTEKDALIDEQWRLIVAIGIVLLVAILLTVGLTRSSIKRRRILSMLRESNDRIQAQQQAIQDQNVRLSEKNARLAELNQEIQAVMHMAAHDLKAPLSRATGLANLIPMAGPVTPEQEQYIKLIQQVSNDGSTMIRDLLDLNKIEANKSKFAREEVDLHDLIKTSLHSFEPDMKRKRLLVDAQLEPQLVDIPTNKQAIQRVVDNLLSNAIKFSPPERNIWVNTYRSNGHVCISVRDEGPGILPEERDRLFKKFQKLSAQPTGNENSTGLGLAITKALVDRLDGEIEVQSHPGHGAEFIVAIPAA